MPVSVSPGNIKMGAIPSVSLPPACTCCHNAPCFNDGTCYALRYMALRPTVRAAYENNFQILQENPQEYWDAVSAACKMTRYFRFHVAGDIVDEIYFENMVRIAKHHPQTEILAFTKKYSIVNAWCETHGLPPANLHIIFSHWPGFPMENPFSFPVCRVLFNGETPDPTWRMCAGNCTDCAVHDGGCWTLQPGETICIKKH